MVAAIEARDSYASGHSRLVARNAKLIAEAIGLKDKQVERVLLQPCSVTLAKSMRCLLIS